MRVLLQRVSRAEVRVEGRAPARIDRGFLLLVGLERGDGEPQIRWMAEKIASLRVFPDDEGRMNRALDEVGGRCLAVSQFTLCGDVRKGRRPGFDRAMPPEEASPLFDRFVARLQERTGPVPAGVFGAHMEVELVNDGPVTLWIERRPEGAG